MPERELLCTFLLDGRRYGLPVADVQEVVRALRATPMPLAPTGVRGLANLRGTIAPSLDLRARLALPPRPPDPAAEPELVVVVRTQSGPVCLLVDEIGDVLEVVAADLEPTPEALSPAVRRLVRGLLKLQDDVLLVLDAARTADLQPPSTP